MAWMPSRVWGTETLAAWMRVRVSGSMIQAREVTVADMPSNSTPAILLSGIVSSASASFAWGVVLMVSGCLKGSRNTGIGGSIDIATDFNRDFTGVIGIHVDFVAPLGWSAILQPEDRSRRFGR